MIKVDAIKDGKGNIVITEDSFEMLLACLDNQKFVGENPQNGDSLSIGEVEYYRGQKDIQDTIDSYNRECREILHQKYIVETICDGYFLTKKYNLQDLLTPWSREDIIKIRDLFKEDILIDGYEDVRLSISADGTNDRPWKQEEIMLIQNTLNKHR